MNPVDAGETARTRTPLDRPSGLRPTGLHVGVHGSGGIGQRVEDQAGEMLAMANQPDETPATGPAEEPAAPAPFKHTRWQNFIRDMWLVLGPAQTGLPPYATAEER